MLHEGPLPHTHTHTNASGAPGHGEGCEEEAGGGSRPRCSLFGAFLSHCCVSQCPPLSQLPQKWCLPGLVSSLLPPALSRLQLCQVQADPTKLTPWDVLASPKSVVPSSELSPQQQSPEQGIQSISCRHPGPSQIPAP